MINKSFTLGIFPKCLKIARVVPLYKGGCRSLPENYRPISILPIFSKVFEKIVHKRLYDYLEKKNILSESQFGYRRGVSTVHAVHCLINHVRTALDRGESALVVFLDLAKAFDTVPHATLLQKMEHYGIRDNCLKWFQSYLQGRQQFVYVGGKSSSISNVHCGVPQGSILGPLLFTIMLNDFYKSNALPAISYADDTAIFSCNSDISKLEESVNDNLSMVNAWMCANKLKLNLNKTKYMIFSNKLKPRISRVSVENTVINECEQYKYLGILLDRKLSFMNHVKALTSKLAFCSHLMRHSSYQLNTKQKLIIYQAYAAPLIRYGISIYGSAPHNSLKQLEVLQRKLVRSFRRHSQRTPTRQLYKKLGIHTVHQSWKYEICLLMHAITHQEAPGILSSLLARPVSHDHYTRQVNLIRKPKCRLALAQKDLSWAGPDQWNGLPAYLRQLNHAKFKYQLYKYLIDVS